MNRLHVTRSVDGEVITYSRTFTNQSDEARFRFVEELMPGRIVSIVTETEEAV